MKECQRIDKVLIILIISLGLSFLLFANSFLLPYVAERKIPLYIPLNNTVYQCGYYEKNATINLDNRIITSHMFSYPYIGVQIDANDYFSLRKKIVMFPYNDTMFGENQSKYYPLILKEFRKIKNEYNMDDDQYVQFIVKFIQSMPYHTNYLSNKYPIVTFTDGCGDCADKSLLLAAILSQENFNVSLFSFQPASIKTSGHMMVGIASNIAINHILCHKDGYAMIETTAENSIGDCDVSYLYTPSIIITRAGNGTKTYETYNTPERIGQTEYEITWEGLNKTSITQIHPTVITASLISHN
jgi:hypothetical protein